MLPGLLVVLLLYFAEASAAPGAAALPFLIDVAILWNLLLFPLAEKEPKTKYEINQTNEWKKHHSVCQLYSMLTLKDFSVNMDF